ncbi:hypothetical protein KC19_11G171100 [Ceratodon purpureus]|uniref:Uncharacterized protein n=1 Tax=Ceratodon purpureus TaxID=3225 RepID=A0A8T0GFE2_CERPU|nr:hypothetical protein KC19_11G171100 [Ceratodon purpureus]
MAPAMKPVTRARKTSSFTWYGDADTSLRGQTPQWPDLESSNGSSADDVSDVPEINEKKGMCRGTPAVRASYESDMSDVGECDDRRRFRNSLVKVSYDSDSCLTPRSRRTLRRTLPGSTEPWPSVKTPAKPTLDTIFSPTHEILHPLQSLRQERSFSNRSIAGSNFELAGCAGRIARTSVTFESFTLPKPESNSLEFDNYIEPSPKPEPNDSSELDSCIKPSSKPKLKSLEFDSFHKSSSKPQLDSLEFDNHIKPSEKPELDSSKFDSYTKPASEPQLDSSEFDSDTKPSAKPQLNSSEFARHTKPSPKPRYTPVKFESYTFPEPGRNSMELDSYTPGLNSQLDSMDFETYRFVKPQPIVTSSMEEEKLEQKRSLIRCNSERADSLPLSSVKEEDKTETALAPNIVVIIVDAEKKFTFVALDWAINVAVRPGDEIIILGVLKHILSPMGYKTLANTDSLYGVNRDVLQLEVNRTTETFQSKLSDSGRVKECEKKKVKLTVRIAPGARVRTVVVRELEVLGATYAIFDRKAMRSRRYYGKHLSCHAVRMRKNGRSTKTITLVPPKARLQTSDISSVSSVSTDRTSSESASPTFWRRITSFRSSRRSRTISPRCSGGSPRLHAISPSAGTHNDQDAFVPEVQEFKDLDTLSTKLKLFQLAEAPKACVSADGYSYKGMESHRKNLPAMSITIPPPICAA